MRLLGDPPPGIQGSRPRLADRRTGSAGTRTVLGGKGPLRRARPARRSTGRALASCAPFCWHLLSDGRLRRELAQPQIPRLMRGENQFRVDKTS
jgi:hypothetical protein